MCATIDENAISFGDADNIAGQAEKSPDGPKYTVIAKDNFDAEAAFLAARYGLQAYQAEDLVALLQIGQGFNEIEGLADAGKISQSEAMRRVQELDAAAEQDHQKRAVKHAQEVFGPLAGLLVGGLPIPVGLTS